ncbi:MAG: hypothetical protein K2Z81_16300 [Cyanobacteria bacterium]|nr:hypothetical protein [Cyanobacteriota bacterium]
MRGRVNFKKSLLLTVAATIGLCTVNPAFAQFNQGDWVTFQNQPMFAIQGTANGFSSEHRAWVAQDNFDNALVRCSHISPGVVQVVKTADAYTIQVGGFYVTTADAESARLAGLTPQQLAGKWADSIKGCLSQQASVANYVASLQKDHMLKANVEVVEQDVMSANMAKLPFRLAEGTMVIDSSDATKVVAVLDRPVEVSKFCLPKSTSLKGVILTDKDGQYVRFEEATLPGGEIVALHDVIASRTFATEAPKPVLMQNMPCNQKTESMEPALIGIGAVESNVAVLQRRSDSRIAGKLVEFENFQ